MWFINEEMVSEEMTVRLALSRPRSTVRQSWIRTVSKNKTGLNEAQTGTLCGTLQIFVVFFSVFKEACDGCTMVALINCAEMGWRATGDTGAVVKLGQCQAPKPWLPPLFLSENHVLSHINPVFYFVTKFRLNFVLPPFFFPPVLSHFAARHEGNDVICGKNIQYLFLCFYSDCEMNVGEVCFVTVNHV